MKVHTVDGLPILLHRHHTPFTNIAVRVKVGSAHEEDNEHGIAHALEHMMFKGTTQRDEMTIDRDLARLGTLSNAATSQYYTTYWVDSRNENWQESAKVLAELFTDATIPEQEWRKEKNVIQSELRRSQDIPSDSHWYDTVEHVFGSKMHHIIGTKESVASFEQKDLVAFRERWYGKPNVYVSIVGDVNEDDPSFIAELFESIPETDHKSTEVLEGVPLEPAVGARYTSRPNMQEARLLGFQKAEPFDADEYMLDDMCMEMLGGGGTALLHERVRKELGMSCYGLYASQYTTPIYSARCIHAGIAPDQMDDLTKEIDQILTNFPDLISEDRFTIAREQLLTRLARREEAAASFNGEISFYLEMGADDPLTHREDSINELRALEFSEVLEYAKTMFVDKRWYWAHMLPG